MLSADDVRRKMLNSRAETTEEILTSIEKKIIAAASQGAVSIWLSDKDGYRENKSTAFEKALNIMRDKGYRFVEDTSNNKPALRIYWQEEQPKTEYHTEYKPRTLKSVLGIILGLAIFWLVITFMLSMAYFAYTNLGGNNLNNYYRNLIVGVAVGFILNSVYIWLTDKGEMVITKIEQKEKPR